MSYSTGTDLFRRLADLAFPELYNLTAMRALQSILFSRMLILFFSKYSSVASPDSMPGTVVIDDQDPPAY